MTCERLAASEESVIAVRLAPLASGHGGVLARPAPARTARPKRAVDEDKVAGRREENTEYQCTGTTRTIRRRPFGSKTTPPWGSRVRKLVNKILRSVFLRFSPPKNVQKTRRMQRPHF